MGLVRWRTDMAGEVSWEKGHSARSSVEGKRTVWDTDVQTKSV